MSRAAVAVLASLAGAFAPPAAAQQTLLPAYGLPSPAPELAAGKSRLALQGGWGLLGGNGARLNGFLGGWAVEAASSDRWSFGGGAGAHALGGRTHVPGSGKVGLTAVGADPGAFAARRFDAFGGRGALHAGLSLPMQVQSYSVATFVVTPSGRVSLTPDTSYSLLVALPVGAAVSRPVGTAWSLTADATLFQVLAGKRWDVLAALGPFSPKRVHRVSPHPVARVGWDLKHASSGFRLLWDYSARPRVDGHGGLWSTALRLGWDVRLGGS